MLKLNRNLTEEENQCLKVLTQITIEDENELAEREVFLKTINERILRNDNNLTLKSFFAFCGVLFTRTNGGKTETTSRQTVSGFQNTVKTHE